MMKEDPKLIGTSFFGRLALAVLAGFVTLMLVSFVTRGLFPFIEFAIAGLVVYLIARR